MMENSLNVTACEKMISPASKYEVACIGYYLKIPIKIRTKKSWLDI